MRRAAVSSAEALALYRGSILHNAVYTLVQSTQTAKTFAISVFISSSGESGVRGHLKYGLISSDKATKLS